MLDLNITMLFQLVNFFIALYVLNILLIRPIRSILLERKAKMDDLAGEAGAFDREAAERLAAYQAELARARQDANAAREQARGAALAEQQDILAAAGKDAQAHLAQAQAAIRAEADAALASLRAQVKGLADKLAARVLA
ncbi:MAG: ATP synthase F0 subunit B [Desulfovibrionaceae bacterium]|nr:ATP synthase F0 subunit B [Desulfovibrionaceae bacterium]